jgi:hypothetical protein
MANVRADYSHGITDYLGRKFIIIEDLNKGKTSLTNDIENVVADIAEKEEIDPRQYLIVYRDSQKIWDGYDAASARFLPCNGKTYHEAMEAMIKMNRPAEAAGSRNNLSTN